jgi:hypothetical protein
MRHGIHHRRHLDRAELHGAFVQTTTALRPAFRTSLATIALYDCMNRELRRPTLRWQFFEPRD